MSFRAKSAKDSKTAAKLGPPPRFFTAERGRRKRHATSYHYTRSFAAIQPNNNTLKQRILRNRTRA